jgi:periplasmic protein TonB
MFNNLIESDTHIADLKRKGSFLFGTMLVYALLLLAAGVASIYTYEAHLDSQSLELTAVVTMLPTTPAPKNLPEHAVNHQPHATANTDNTAQVPMRTMRVADISGKDKVPTEIAVTGNSVPPAPPNAVIGNKNLDVAGISSLFSNNRGPVGTSASANSGGHESARDTPPPDMPRVEKPKQTRPVTLGVIESKVIYKAVPPYPPLAKQARASGPVPVEILLDEQGHVISARATGGHPLLRDAAVKAAYQTKFSPTYLSNQPVKVSGMITFNFVLH